ncbi:hypothetical protein ACFU5O_18400 [Streptomyces sp. NPDC057445]|uniref:hypothetical protein n=1 Tax=Streptomyces sp. NPDC057445 TaxID=3346136 RepID=UPI0036C824B3
MSTAPGFPTPRRQQSDNTDRTDARLAEIKRLAAAGPEATGVVTDEGLYSEAAIVLAGKRAERGDLVGSLIWEVVAHQEATMRERTRTRVQGGASRDDDASAQPASATGTSPDADGEDVPFCRTRPEGRGGE